MITFLLRQKRGNLVTSTNRTTEELLWTRTPAPRYREIREETRHRKNLPALQVTGFLMNRSHPGLPDVPSSMTLEQIIDMTGEFVHLNESDYAAY